MYLGKLCNYAGKCPVYNNEISIKGKPSFIIRNVFCNRGEKGWKNCQRFKAYEKGNDVGPEITPNGKINSTENYDQGTNG